MENKTLPDVAAGRAPFEVEYRLDLNGQSRFPQKGQPGFLSVPDGNHPEAVAIRAHEYGHLALTSEGKVSADFIEKAMNLGIKPEWANAVLDVAVNYFMLGRGVAEIRKLPLYFPEMTPGPAARKNAALAWLRSSGLESERAVREKANLYLDGSSLLSDNVTTISGLVSIRFGIDDQLLRAATQLQTFYDFAEDTKHEDPFDTKAEKGSRCAAVEIMRPPEKEPGKKDKQWKFWDPIGENKWGTMHPIDIDLVNVNRKALAALRPRPAYCGPFRYPLRALLPAFDGSAFAGYRKAKGGTILLDLSGSMEIANEQIHELLDKAPALVVAGYCGESHGTKGFLGVIASKGRYWDSRRRGSHFPGNGNVIDGPALMWLGKMPQPRIWISDGAVTGCGDAQSKNLVIQAQALTRYYRITRFDNINAYMEYSRNKIIS